MPKDKLILYYSPDCPACKSIRPQVAQLTNKHGVSLQEINVHQCPREDNVCATMKWVPTAYYEGREVPLKSLKSKIEELGRTK